MPLKVTCPSGHVLTLPESKAGKSVRCPQCEQYVMVPAINEDVKAKKPPPLNKTSAPPMLPVERTPAATGETASGGPRESLSPPPLPKHNPAALEAQSEYGAEPQPKRRGMRHNPGQAATAYWFGGALIFAAMVGTCPSVLEFVDHFQHVETSSGIARWAYLLILLAAVQIAYAVYVMQLPDWGTVWVATLFTLLVAAGYATLLGFLLLSNGPSHSVGVLQLAESLRHKAVSWCFLMLSLSCLLTYIGGRAGAGWYRAHATIVAALGRERKR